VIERRCPMVASDDTRAPDERIPKEEAR
jgi:hypothetical protein